MFSEEFQKIDAAIELPVLLVRRYLADLRKLIRATILRDAAGDTFSMRPLSFFIVTSVAAASIIAYFVYLIDANDNGQPWSAVARIVADQDRTGLLSVAMRPLTVVITVVAGGWVWKRVLSKSDATAVIAEPAWYLASSLTVLSAVPVFGIVLIASSTSGSTLFGLPNEDSVEFVLGCSFWALSVPPILFLRRAGFYRSAGWTYLPRLLLTILLCAINLVAITVLTPTALAEIAAEETDEKLPIAVDLTAWDVKEGALCLTLALRNTSSEPIVFQREIWVCPKDSSNCYGPASMSWSTGLAPVFEIAQKSTGWVVANFVGLPTAAIAAPAIDDIFTIRMGMLDRQVALIRCSTSGGPRSLPRPCEVLK